MNILNEIGSQIDDSSSDRMTVGEMKTLISGLSDEDYIIFSEDSGSEERKPREVWIDKESSTVRISLK